jgi:hypothetical protein
VVDAKRSTGLIPVVPVNLLSRENLRQIILQRLNRVHELTKLPVSEAALARWTK